MQTASDLMMKRNDEIRRGEAEMVNHDREKDHDQEAESSAGEEDEFSEEEIEPETVKAGE